MKKGFVIFLPLLSLPYDLLAQIIQMRVLIRQRLYDKWHYPVPV